ncbi:MAG: alpha/beta fold hydrolase, partial [Dehalococcoidia bacterium]
MPMFGTPGERVAFEAQGSGPPLLLLHGFTASSASFLSNIPELAERFTVISVDLLGHGASDAPESLDPYLPDPAVDRLVGLLDHLGHQQVLLCGHSLGGALALRFALDYPARSAGLIVINSNSAAGPPEWRETAQRGLEAMAARARAEGTGFLRESRLYPARSGRLPLAARDALVRDFD